MQQDNINMDDKLRQLENQQLPDLSKMDAHWKQMEQMLDANAVKPATNFFKQNSKLLFLAASVFAAISFVWFLSGHTSDKIDKPEKKITINAKETEKKESNNIGTTDTTIKTIVHRNNSKPPSIKLNAAVVQKLTEDKIETITNIQPDAALVINQNELGSNENLVENFYNQLQKPGQEFTINAEKENSITCSEGTKIFIPAATFIDEKGNSVNGPVKIIVSEYYKYSDIIAANLTTMSGGKQLITGGMLRIIAEQKSHPVKIRNDKGIVISMPTKSYDDAMRLFTSETESDKISANYNADISIAKTASSVRYRNIDWRISGMQSSMPPFDGKTNFLNMQDEPYAVRTGRKTTGKFAIPKNSELTVAEAKKILNEKYGGYYDGIKVKKVKWVSRSRFIIADGNNEIKTRIGDSIRLTLDQALRWKYIDKKDSAFYAEKIKSDSIKYFRIFFANKAGWKNVIRKKNIFGKDVFIFKNREFSVNDMDSVNKYYDEYIKTIQAYSFTIKNTGWVNCDRFNDYQNKIDFVLNLPEGVNAENFVSRVVFTSIRSVMPGNTSNNKIGFLNVPVNMPVYVVGLGEKDGKVVSFMEKLKTGVAEVNISNFEETTPEAFRKKLSNLDL